MLSVGSVNVNATPVATSADTTGSTSACNNKSFSFANFTSMMDGTAIFTGQVVRVPGKKVLAIISSTFTDTMHERNAILGVISTDLRQEIASKGYEIEIQFVDMRYGVRNENTLEHDTWLACAVEIERCKRESEGTFFISLQAQKYGYQMAPKNIPRQNLDSVLATMNENMKIGELLCLQKVADTFRKLMNDVSLKSDIFEFLYETTGTDVCLKSPFYFFALSSKDFGDSLGMDSTGILKAKFANSRLIELVTRFNDDIVMDIIRRHVLLFDTMTVKAFMKIWYQLDENSLPPRYELKHLKDFDDKLFWNVALPLIVHILQDISFEPGRDQDILVARSVTEYETRLALQTKESASRCYWFHRTFAGGVTTAHAKYWDYSDAVVDVRTKSKIDSLTQFMRDKLKPLDRIKVYDKLTLDSVLRNDNLHKNYLESFQNDFKDVLRSDISTIGEAYKLWLVDGCGLGMNGKDLNEIMHHVKWAQQKIALFEGREMLVQKCLELLSVLHVVKNDKDVSKDVHESLDRKEDSSLLDAEEYNEKDVYINNKSQWSCFDCTFINSFFHASFAIRDPKRTDDVGVYCEGINREDVDVIWRCKVCNFVNNLEVAMDWCAECDSLRFSEDSVENPKDSVENHVKVHIDKKNFSGISLCIVGVSGSGKTALVSFISSKWKENNPDLPVLIRFCGTSSGSSDAFSLMRSICFQIHFLFYGGDWQLEVVEQIRDYEKLVAYFHSLLKKHPLFLVIDSLDQLTNNYKEQSELSFLKGVLPHPEGRIIVTTLPYDDKYRYLCSKKLDDSEVPRVDVDIFVNENDPMDSTEIRKIAEIVLRKGKHSLTQEQWSIFQTSVVKESTALYMNLSVYVMSAWKSFDSPSENVLTPTVNGLINQIFDGLERKFGVVLMRAIIAYLSFAVEGVSDTEMIDLLSIDDEVLKSVFQYSSPDIYRLPYHVWLRVRDTLGPLLVERESGVFAWYHRQLKETGKERYMLPDGKDMKKYIAFLATYFGNLLQSSIIESRHIYPHERFLNAYPSYSKDVIVNKRRCIEACHHLITAGMYEEAAEEMFSVPALYAHCRVSYDHCFSYLKDTIVLYHHVNTSLSSGRSVKKKLSAKLKDRIEHYKRFLVSDMTLIALDASRYLMECSDRQPLESYVYQDFNDYFWSGKSSRIGIFESQKSIVDNMEATYVVCKSLGGLYEKFTPLIASLEGHTDNVLAVAVSEHHIFSGASDSLVLAWDRFTGECLCALRGHTDWVSAVAVSCDGTRVISASRDKTLKIWESSTGECLFTIYAHENYIKALDVSSDGHFVVSGSHDNLVKVWSLATGDLISTCKGHAHPVMSVAVSSDLIHIASASQDTTIKLFIWETGDCVLTLEGGHVSYVESVIFSFAGDKVISGSSDDDIIVWDSVTGDVLMKLEGHDNCVVAVALAPDGNIVSASEDDTLKTWNIVTGECISTIGVGGVNAIALSRDGLHVVTATGNFGSVDNKVKIWSTQSTGGQASIRGHNSAVNAVAVSTDGFIASGSEDKDVRLWDSVKMKCISIMEGYDNSFERLTSTLAPIQYSRVERLNPYKYKKNHELLKGHSDSVKAVAFSSDGRYIISAGKNIIVWDRVENKKLHTILEHEKGVYSLAVTSAWPEIISGSHDGTVKIFDLPTGECCMTLEDKVSESEFEVAVEDEYDEEGLLKPKGLFSWVWSVTVTADNDFIISGGSDTFIRVWDPHTGELVFILKGHNKPVRSVAVFHDGQFIVSGSEDKTCKIWHFMNRELVFTLRGHSDTVSAVAVNVDCSNIVTGSHDMTLKIWGAFTGELRFTLYGHTGYVLSVSVSLNGLIISGSEDKTVKLWTRHTGF